MVPGWQHLPYGTVLRILRAGTEFAGGPHQYVRHQPERDGECKDCVSFFQEGSSRVFTGNVGSPVWVRRKLRL